MNHPILRPLPSHKTQDPLIIEDGRWALSAVQRPAFRLHAYIILSMSYHYYGKGTKKDQGTLWL
jgi:hypothetical protein